jgi:hypothetical protein
LPDIKWLESPEEKDYSAAFDYLSLILPAREAENVAALLEADPSIVWHPAKDLFRASHLDLLPKSNRHVAHNLKKIEKGEPLSPILLVRGKRDKGVPLTIADGFHRLSAVYHASEDALIPAKIVSA